MSKESKNSRYTSHGEPRSGISDFRYLLGNNPGRKRRNPSEVKKLKEMFMAGKNLTGEELEQAKEEK